MSAGAETACRRRWVLCVTPDESSLAAARAALPRSDYPVTWATDGKQARSLIEGTRFDVLLLDTALADGHGLPLLDSVRARSPGLPVVMLSSGGDDALTLTALKRGANGFVRKEDMAGTLLDLLNHIMRGLEPGGENSPAAGGLELLRLSERVYRNMLEVMDEGCLVVNGRGEITLANPSLGIMRGEEESALPGRPLFGLFDVPTATSIREELFRCVFHGRPARFSFEGYLQAADGEPIPVLVSGRSLVRDDGQYEGCVLTVTNVARMKAAEDRLKQLSDAKSLFLRTASHDLRTPLAVMKCALDNVLDNVTGPVDPEQRQQLEVVQRAIVRMERLVTDLLDVTRIEAGMLTVEKRPLSIEALLEEAASGFSALARERHVALELELADGPIAIQADEERMAQAINNLLGNALRFARSRIRIEAHKLGRSATIAIANDGPIIPGEYREVIFEPFRRASTGPGAGLGLSIVRGIVNAHGGEIHLVSPTESGDGVRFTMTLPSVEAPAVTP